jgi:predicted MFS family arabinose efflux permease
LFIVGFFLLVAFLYWQSVATNALMPLWVWKDRNFSLLMATFCLGFMGFSAVTFFLSLYLQEVKHLTALDITVRLLPMVVSGVLVNVVCGLVLHRVSNKLLTGIGALAYTASFLILSFMKEDAIYWAYIFPALVLVVVGADIQFNVTNMYVLSSLPPSQQSIAGGIFNTVSKLCNNLGLGIATSVNSAVANQMTATTPAINPYLAVYWFAAAAAGLSLFMVPFLTLGTQGGSAPEPDQFVTRDAGGETKVGIPEVSEKQ